MLACVFTPLFCVKLFFWFSSIARDFRVFLKIKLEDCPINEQSGRLILLNSRAVRVFVRLGTLQNQRTKQLREMQDFLPFWSGEA